MDPANTDIRHEWEEEVKTEGKASPSQRTVDASVSLSFLVIFDSDIYFSAFVPLYTAFGSLIRILNIL